MTYDSFYLDPCKPHGKRRWKGVYRTKSSPDGGTYTVLVGWEHTDGTVCYLSEAFKTEAPF